MTVLDRFLKYARIETTSCEANGQCPSTPGQKVLGAMLAEELRSMGVTDAEMDEHGYVYATIPAKNGAGKPAIGLIAHMDTSDGVKGPTDPQIIRNYDGNAITLKNGVVIDGFDFLPELKGTDLVVTAGDSVLGADDKAGVAEIMTLCEKMTVSDAPDHRKICVAFTPDEEIGRGADLFDVERFGADFAYTVDGGRLEEINFETFNAAAAHWEIRGFNVHPGSAKNTLINANLVAMEINSMLPAGDVPEKTEAYEGFFHLTDMQGCVEKASLDYIVRDHDAALFAQRERMLRHIEELINEKYGAGTATLTIREQYRNMAEVLEKNMEIVERAERAIVKAGLTPKRVPIRGGTDGSQLSFRGLPCPNLGTGGYGFHGPYEHITAENMDKAVEILLNVLSPET